MHAVEVLKLKPNPEVIVELEGLLSQAKDGEIQGITYVLCNGKTTAYTGTAGNWSKERALFAFFTWLSRFIGVAPEQG